MYSEQIWQVVEGLVCVGAVGTAAGVGGLLRARAGRKSRSRSRSGSPPGDGSDAQTDQEHHGSAEGDDNEPGRTVLACVSVCPMSVRSLPNVCSILCSVASTKGAHIGQHIQVRKMMRCHPSYVCRCCYCTAIHGCLLL